MFFTVVRQIGRDNSDVDANGNSKIHFVSSLRPWILPYNNLGEFSHPPELTNKQYIFEDKEKIWYSHPVSHSTRMISSPNILQQKPGPSCFAQRSRNPCSFTFCGVCLTKFSWYCLKGTNDKIRCVCKSDPKNILASVYKCKNENALQLWRKMTIFSLAKLWPIRGFKSTSFIMQEEPELTINQNLLENYLKYGISVCEMDLPQVHIWQFMNSYLHVENIAHFEFIYLQSQENREWKCAVFKWLNEFWSENVKTIPLLLLL